MTSAQLTAAGSTLSYTTKKNRTYSDAADHRYSQLLFAPAFIESLPRRTSSIKTCTTTQMYLGTLPQVNRNREGEPNAAGWFALCLSHFPLLPILQGPSCLPSCPAGLRALVYPLRCELSGQKKGPLDRIFAFVGMSTGLPLASELLYRCKTRCRKGKARQRENPEVKKALNCGR